MDNTSIRIPLLLPNNTVIRVLATDLGPTRERDVASKSIEDLLHVDAIQSAIEGVGQMVLGAMSRLAPTKISAEFGIDMGLESGKLTALWVKGTGTANLKITLEWSNAAESNEHK